MKNSVYDLLNDIQSSPEIYPAAPVTQEDMRNWKKAFDAKRRAGAGSKKHHWKKYAAVAAAAALLIGAGSLPATRITAYAAIKSVAYDLGQLLGISKDLEPYTTVVGQSESKDGITVTLNEVILYENMMNITDFGNAFGSQSRDNHRSTRRELFLNIFSRGSNIRRNCRA